MKLPGEAQENFHPLLLGWSEKNKKKTWQLYESIKFGMLK